jgi:hypothetical protein
MEVSPFLTGKSGPAGILLPLKQAVTTSIDADRILAALYNDCHHHCGLQGGKVLA